MFVSGFFKLKIPGVSQSCFSLAVVFYGGAAGGERCVKKNVCSSVISACGVIVQFYRILKNIMAVFDTGDQKANGGESKLSEQLYFFSTCRIEARMQRIYFNFDFGF